MKGALRLSQRCFERLARLAREAPSTWVRADPSGASVLERQVRRLSIHGAVAPVECQNSCAATCLVSGHFAEVVLVIPRAQPIGVSRAPRAMFVSVRVGPPKHTAKCANKIAN